MFSGLMAALPAVAGLAGSIFGSHTSAQGAHEANEANRDIAANTNQTNRDIANDQMAFQERMSSSAYQRSVLDMKAAGINPMMAANNGGASSPSGASIAAVTGAPQQNEKAGYATSAVDAMRLGKEMAAVNSQIDQNKASAALSKALAKSAASQNMVNLNSARKVKFDADSSESNSRLNKLEADVGTSLPGRAVKWMSRIAPLVGGTSAAARAGSRVLGKFLQMTK